MIITSRFAGKCITCLLRPLIPPGDDDLSEVNEVLSEAELRNETQDRDGGR